MRPPKMQNSLQIACATAVLSATGLALQSGPGSQASVGSESTPHNVVVIFIDDVGTDLLRTYDEVNRYDGIADPGAAGIYVRAPVIDSIAAQGVTFLNAFTTPVCSAARASLLTGMSTTRHGIGKIIRPDLVGDLVEFNDPGYEHRTLVEMLRERSVHSGIFGKWHLNMDPVTSGIEGARGWAGIRELGHWDEIQCTFGNLDIPPMPHGGGYYRYFHHIDTTGVGRTTVLTEYATTRQFSDAKRYVNSAPEPFLAYIAPNACHPPLDDLPPAELVNTSSYLQGPPSYHKNFAATLEALDSEIGNFLDGMDPERKKNTTFIFMGDNGTDGKLAKSMTYDSGLDLGMTYQSLLKDRQDRFKHSVYEGGVRVPLIVWGKGVNEPGRTSDALVNITDLFPTIADLYEVDPGNVDGYSFDPILKGEDLGLWTHARQSVVIDFFFENGDADAATDMRQVGAILNIPGDGQYKVVRKYGLPGWSTTKSFLPPPGVVVDEFYKLYDASGQPVDPRELSELDTAPGSPYRNQYLRVVTMMDRELHPETVYNFCESFPNSTGASAQISMEGTSSIEQNDLVLHASDVPANVPAFFFYSWYEDDYPFVNGLLCVESQAVGLFRFNLVYSDKNGQLVQPLDHQAPGELSGDISVGSTWKFQAWYRDVAAGGSFSNTTNGLSIHFTP